MAEKQCISTYVEINSMGAWTLWDSRSMMSGMTPGFAHMAEVVVHNLKDPHLIQLATIGSKSTIKHSANITMKIGKVVIDDYLDIVNFDCYDLILGAGFMCRNRVILNFKEHRVMVQDHQIKGVEWDGKMHNCLRQYRMTTKEGHLAPPEKAKFIKGKTPQQLITEPSQDNNGSKLNCPTRPSKRWTNKESPFCDNPSAPTLGRLYYDTRVPNEWNAMVANMAPRAAKSPPDTGFRDPEPNEIEEIIVSLPTGPKPKVPQSLPEPTKMPPKKDLDKVIRGRTSKLTKASPSKFISDVNIERKRQQIYSKFKDILEGTLRQLPLFREVNHEMHLIDKNLRYKTRPACCPHHLRQQFYQKLSVYTDAGWWESKQVDQALPLLCLAKKDGHIQTVVDA
jgi:hypothetical protein